jgi:hypothetical protein
MTAEKGWIIYRPVMPKPAIWEQLKKARTVAQIQERWAWNGRVALALCLFYRLGAESGRGLSPYAEEILAAKRLPNYPERLHL